MMGGRWVQLGRRRTCARVALVSAAALLASRAIADEALHWNVADGNFGFAGNWNPNVVPGSSDVQDDAAIDFAGTLPES